MSFLNTVPLVWGMMHGDQRELFELEFAVPSECADQLADGRADIGIAPVATLLDQDLRVFRGAGIACRQAVRSILLISKTPFTEVRTLAGDSSSRTSVLLARIILARRHGAEPSLISRAPDLEAMLDSADAALIIGDPALRCDPDELRARGLRVADLGADWIEMTGLPMVFAVWAGRPEVWTPERERAFVESARLGMEHVDEIARSEHESRGVSLPLAREYLTRHIAFDLGEREYRGMERYLELAREIGPHEFVTTAVVSGE